MTEDALYDVMRQGLWASVLISSPLLAAALVTGVVVGLFQALTSIQEATLTFVPKIVAMLVAAALTMPMMLTTLIDFTRELFERIATGG